MRERERWGRCRKRKSVKGDVLVSGRTPRSIVPRMVVAMRSSLSVFSQGSIMRYSLYPIPLLHNMKRSELESWSRFPMRLADLQLNLECAHLFVTVE